MLRKLHKYKKEKKCCYKAHVSAKPQVKIIPEWANSSAKGSVSMIIQAQKKQRDLACWFTVRLQYMSLFHILVSPLLNFCCHIQVPLK